MTRHGNLNPIPTTLGNLCWSDHPRRAVADGASGAAPARTKGARMSTTGQPTGRLVARRHWLEYDPVALAVLVIGIGIIELLALII